MGHGVDETPDNIKIYTFFKKILELQHIPYFENRNAIYKAFLKADFT